MPKDAPPGLVRFKCLRSLATLARCPDETRQDKGECERGRAELIRVMHEEHHTLPI
jgi:hypothetical protein